MPPKIQRKEWQSVILFALLTTLILSIPYWVAQSRAGSDWEFNGFTFGIDDGNAYLGKIHLGVEGQWKFHLFYTSEDHRGGFGVYLPFILIGQALRLLDQTSPYAMMMAWQLWRIIACFCLIVVMYAFISLFLYSPRQRWLALLLATWGGGLGWILILVGQDSLLGTSPIEFYIPEGFSFLALYGLPHIAMARAAMLLGFISFYWALQGERVNWHHVTFAGNCWYVVGLLVTFYWGVLYVLLAAWGMALWWYQGRFPSRYALVASVAGGMTLPMFAVSAFVFADNPAFREWSAQNHLPSPHPLHYLIGYGLWAGLGMVGVRWAWHRLKKTAQPHYLLLLVWPVASLVMVYLPISVQRRMAEGVILPLSILAVAGLSLLDKRKLQTVVMALLLPSSALLWLGTLVITLTPSCGLEICLYRPTAELQAMNWLEDHADSQAVVVSSMRTGNYLPIETDLRPFLGLGTETLNSEAKIQQTQALYQGQGEDNFLTHYKIDYIWVGPLEREWGDESFLGQNPHWPEQTRLLYDRDGYQIYEVIHHAP